MARRGFAGPLSIATPTAAHTGVLSPQSVLCLFQKRYALFCCSHSMRPPITAAIASPASRSTHEGQVPSSGSYRSWELKRSRRSPRSRPRFRAGPPDPATLIAIAPTAAERTGAPSLSRPSTAAAARNGTIRSKEPDLRASGSAPRRGGDWLHFRRWPSEPRASAARLTRVPVPPLTGLVSSPRGTGTDSRTTANRSQSPGVAPELGRLDEIHEALVLGTRDYVRKNGFDKVVIGLSGGIDSSLTAAIAAEALSPDDVIGVTMPSQYTSCETRSDAALLAERLGIALLTVPIQPVFSAFLDSLDEAMGPGEPGVERENLQARIRGNILMALSNRHGWLVLTTGNKSETAVGYCTLYGDTAGGFAVIKDVPKTLVYELAGRVNAKAGQDVIPQSVIERAPTPELKEDQKDQDSLPPYEELDRVLEAYVERDMAPDEIAARGFDIALVEEVARLVDGSEYKRRQAPPGVKITPKAFGRDRRLPVTNLYTARPLKEAKVTS